MGRGGVTARGIASSFTLAWVVLRTMVADFGILSHTLTTLYTSHDPFDRLRFSFRRIIRA